MSTVEQKSSYSIEEYLALEEESIQRHEFFKGEIFAMSGGSIDHGAISVNWTSEIRSKTKGSNCRGFNSDVKVHIESEEAFVYPDASIVCGEVELYNEKNHTILNPAVIIEVLSESTEAYDRGFKFHRYPKIPSLQEYIITSQTIPNVEVYRKEENGWTSYQRYSKMEESVLIRSLGISVPMSEIYYQVNFSPT